LVRDRIRLRISFRANVTFIAKEQHFPLCQLFGCAIQTINCWDSSLHKIQNDKNKTRQDKTRKKTRQDRAGQDRTKQDKAMQDNKTRQHRVGQDYQKTKKITRHDKTGLD
jgi:hypothetical protein